MAHLVEFIPQSSMDQTAMDRTASHCRLPKVRALIPGVLCRKRAAVRSSANPAMRGLSPWTLLSFRQVAHCHSRDRSGESLDRRALAFLAGASLLPNDPLFGSKEPKQAEPSYAQGVANIGDSEPPLRRQRPDEPLRGGVQWTRCGPGRDVQSGIFWPWRSNRAASLPNRSATASVKGRISTRPRKSARPRRDAAGSLDTSTPS